MHRLFLYQVNCISIYSCAKVHWMLSKISLLIHLPWLTHPLHFLHSGRIGCLRMTVIWPLCVTWLVKFPIATTLYFIFWYPSPWLTWLESNSESNQSNLKFIPGRVTSRKVLSGKTKKLFRYYSDNRDKKDILIRVWKPLCDYQKIVQEEI